MIKRTPQPLSARVLPSGGPTGPPSVNSRPGALPVNVPRYFDEVVRGATRCSGGHHCASRLRPAWALTSAVVGASSLVYSGGGGWHVWSSSGLADEGSGSAVRRARAALRSGAPGKRGR
jgi:hypothetical protein